MGLKLGYKDRTPRRSKGRTARHAVSLFLCSMGLITLLSACNLASISKPSFRKHSSVDVRREKLVTDVSVHDAREVAKPISSAEGFSTDTPHTTIGSATPPPSVMKSQSGVFVSKGLKMERLFDERIKNDNKRFDRLEDSVQDVHDYLANISPSLDRLVAIEGDIQHLVVQLETLLKEDPTLASPPVDLMPMKKKSSPKKRQASASIKNNYAAKIIARVRSSTSPAKTRLVFELSEKMPFSYDLDNAENLLTLSFPKAQDSALSLSALKRSKLFKSMSVTPQEGGGYIVALDLSREVSVINEGKISPNRDNPLYRLYLDLK